MLDPEAGQQISFPVFIPQYSPSHSRGLWIRVNLLGCLKHISWGGACPLPLGIQSRHWSTDYNVWGLLTKFLLQKCPNRFVVILLTPAKKFLILPNLLVTFEDNTDILIIFLICKFNEELKYQRGENSLCESEFCYHSHTKQNLPQDLCTRCAFCLQMSPDLCKAGSFCHSHRPSLTPRLKGDLRRLLSQCHILLSL